MERLFGTLNRIGMIVVFFCILVAAVVLPVAAQDLNGAVEMDLIACLDYAQENNLQIKSAAEELEQVKGQSMEVMAIALPNLSFTGSYTKQEQPFISAYGMGSEMPAGGGDMGAEIPEGAAPMSVPVSGDDEYYSANFQLTQALFLGGRAVGAIRGSKMTRKLGREKLRMTENQVIARTKIMFYTYLFSKQAFAVQEERLETLQHHYEIAKKKADVGVVSPFEVMRAEVEAANIKPEVIKARNYIKIAEQNLKLSMGMDYRDKISIKGELGYQPFEYEFEELLAQALEERPDIRMASLALGISREELVVNRSGFLPQLYFFYNYKGSKPNFDEPGGEDWDFNYSYGLSLKVPIFDGLYSYGKYYYSKAAIAKAQFEKQLTLDTVPAEVREQILNLREAEEIILSQEKSIELAEEGLKIAETRYESGMGTQSEVMDSQVALTYARLNYYQALLSYQTSLANLINAIGGRDPRDA